MDRTDRMNVLFVFGTRPEAIKMIPIITEFKRDDTNFNVRICITAQHREMLDQVLFFFKIQPDYDLNLMTPNQSLPSLTSKIVEGLDNVIIDCRPDLIFVQGDTTTAFAGALVGFYNKIKVVHVEAGLRSRRKYSPFPEEMNRILIGNLADFHFAPTESAKWNLLRANIQENVWVVGNSCIDALFLCLNIIKDQGEEQFRNFFSFLDLSKRIILVTGHRRESFGTPFRNVCLAIKDINEEFKDVQIVYPVHMNPNISNPVHDILGGITNIFLIKPIEYPYLIWLMEKTAIVLTDSGGIQEEAPSLGKPVLVMREVTERVEGIKAGTAKLVGTDRMLIKKTVCELLTNRERYDSMSNVANPYGDGKSSERIVTIIKKHFGL